MNTPCITVHGPVFRLWTPPVSLFTGPCSGSGHPCITLRGTAWRLLRSESVCWNPNAPPCQDGALGGDSWDHCLHRTPLRAPSPLVLCEDPVRGRPSVDGSRPSPDTAGLQDREKATSVVFGCNGPNRQRQRPGRGWGAAGASREDPAQFLSTGVVGPQGWEARGGSWWRRRRGPMLSGRGPHQAPCIPAQPQLQILRQTDNFNSKVPVRNENAEEKTSILNNA